MPMDATTPSSGQMGIQPQKLYGEISKWSLYRIKKVLIKMMVCQAVEEIKKVKKKVQLVNQELTLRWQWMIV